MSKELTPLEALKKVKKFKDDCCMFGSSDIEIDKDLDIIEKALKEYEKPKKIVGSISFEQSMENYVKNNCPSIAKKLKALEIIKERRVDVARLLVSNSLKKYNDFDKRDILAKLTQEEFDFLKEMLK